MLTAEIARKRWHYEPETGHFFWKVSPRYNVNVGDRAGWYDGKYIRIKYARKNYKTSRLAWLWMTGSWPKQQIDHINGDKTDDRFCNLREATNAQNCRNRRKRSNNIAGLKGVSKQKYAYVSQICVDGKNIYLGSFKDALEAKVAYDAAAERFHGQFRRA